MNRAEKQRHNADQRVREIKAQAKIVFLKKGFSASTMEEIAKLAGVSKGTVYLYFRNKDDLFVSLIVSHFEEYARLLKRFREQLWSGQYNSGWEVFNELYEIYLALYEHDPDAIRILQTYLLENLNLQIDEKTRDHILQLAKETRLIGQEILSECMKRGLLPKINPRQLIDILIPAFLGIVQLEDRKFRLSGKNHLADGLNLCFSLIADGLATWKERKAVHLFRKRTVRNNARRR